MEKNYDHCIIQIEDCLISSEIITEFFACDYEACRGACCIVGDSGAPLEEWEPEEIERNYDVFSPLMSEAGREAVSRTGFFEIDVDGQMVTPLVAAPDPRLGKKGAVDEGIWLGKNETFDEGTWLGKKGTAGQGVRRNPADRECAFSCIDCEGNCLCAIEKKWFEGKSSFRKPASCHLYPIRVTKLGDGQRALNLHRWDICRPAYEKGRRENVRVYEFLEEPIRQYFGSEFHTAMKQCAEHLL